MRKAAEYEAEEIWLHEFLRFQQEICLEVEAQETMREFGVTMSDVLYVLRNGKVIFADRDECGARINVYGRNCDGEEISVAARMVSEMMHVAVIRVKKHRRTQL